MMLGLSLLFHNKCLQTWSSAFIFAPDSTRNLQVVICPENAASCNGVRPTSKSNRKKLANGGYKLNEAEDVSLFRGHGNLIK